MRKTGEGEKIRTKGEGTQMGEWEKIWKMN
jgi:hypothetical protein